MSAVRAESSYPRVGASKRVRVSDPVHGGLLKWDHRCTRLPKLCKEDRWSSRQQPRCACVKRILRIGPMHS